MTWLAPWTLRQDMRHVLDLDRKRRLLYTYHSLELIEAKTGLQDPVKWMDVDISQIPVLAWAGLIWEDPGLTINQVRDLLKSKTQGNEISLGKMAVTIFEAIIAFPKEDKLRSRILKKVGTGPMFTFPKLRRQRK